MHQEIFKLVFIKKQKPNNFLFLVFKNMMISNDIAIKTLYYFLFLEN